MTLSSKLKNIINIVALLLAPIFVFLFGLYGTIPAIILLIIYAVLSEKKSGLRWALLIACGVGALLCWLNYFALSTMDNRGLDGLGEALFYAVVVEFGRYVLMICPLILLIIDNRKFIFTKKFLIPFAAIALAIAAYFPVRYLFTTSKSSPNTTATVKSFETILKQRNLLSDATDYRLYGISSENDRGIGLNFDTNKNDQYPLYIYSVIDFPWLIYYTNNEIYAIYGYYWDNQVSRYDYDPSKISSKFKEQKIIWDYPTTILSENTEISIYNPKTNRIEKGSKIAANSFNYYTKDRNKEDSVFIDIPSKESWGTEVTQIKHIDYDTLKERAKTIKDSLLK